VAAREGAPVATSPPGIAGVHVDVLKRIPLASGMAGGSADAAAALLGMDALAGGLLASDLPEMAAALGSDVPFALAGGTRVARGRGERLDAVACPAGLWWILGTSPFGVSTPAVFRRHDELRAAAAAGHATEEPVAGRVAEGPAALGNLLGALAAGDAAAIASCLRNDLVPAARDLEPRLAPLETAMRDAGVLGSVVSGSGPTVVGLCRDEAHAREVAVRAAPAFARVEVVSSARRGAELATGPRGGFRADEGH
jgi:4-diphosphocytidyl-2-C-methyl-D-erythritol kinase